MTRDILLFGHCPVAVRISQSDVDSVRELCRHNPAEIANYARAMTELLPGKLLQYGGVVDLAIAYARQTFAAQIAADETAAGQMRAVA